MKIVTWNINSVKMRLPLLLDFINETSPDILLLQELKCETDKFPYDELSHLSYNFYIHGEKSYNGVAILSKYPADEIIYNFPNNPCESQSRFLEIALQLPIGYCRIISLYAPNGGEVSSDKFSLKLKFYDALIAYLESKKNFEEKIIVGGDFNIAPFDIDVYSPKHFEGSTCFTTEEKQKLRVILNSGYEDLYRLLHPNSQEFSWWDYRAGAFEHNKGMRIDMLLATTNACGFFKECYMDYHMRSKAKPSDHVPIIASTK